SMLKTAARKRVQKWLLLACRVGLLALLIAAVAQPAKKLAGGWTAPGKTAIAAIVVDTSYSMLLKDRDSTLLARADSAVHELLTSQLSNARVAIFRTPLPPDDQPERLIDAHEIIKQWVSFAE